VRKFWLTLGTILAGTWCVSNAFQRADAQDDPLRPTIVTGSGAVFTGPGPQPAGGGRAFIYSAPSLNAVIGEFGGEGMSDEMQVLMQQDAKLEEQVQHTVAAYSDPQTEAKMREDLRIELSELLGQQFDARQQRRELEIKQIEERVKKLREALEKRSAAKEKIIERRLNDLLTDAEGLGWGDAAPGTPAFNVFRSPYGPGGGVGRGLREGGGSPHGPTLQNDLRAR